MAELAGGSAARLSADIGDVLAAIRRLIAEDEDLSAARSRIASRVEAAADGDAGDALARRHGGNAALARRLVQNAQAASDVSAVSPEIIVPASQPVAASDALVEEDDFAEAFDWKARMRPDIGLDRHAADAVLPRLVLDEAMRAVPVHGLPMPAHPAGASINTSLHLVPDVPALAAPTPCTPCAIPASTAEPTSDGEILRGHLREIIREELQGEMGARFSANLRAVIRREIAAAVDAQIDRL